MDKKQVVFKSRGKFIGYTAALVCVGLSIGLVVGSIAGVVFTRIMSDMKKQTTQEEIKEVSGEDYDITKCVALGKYSGREISLTATDEDIQLEVDNLLDEYTTYEKIKDRKAQNGDMVYADFEGYVDGKVVNATCGSDYIEIGSGEWMNGFEDAIIGMKPGKTKKFSINVPEGLYGDDSVDGKTVQFKLNLKYVCGESIVPEYNDEFVESVSNYKTVAEYNAYLKEKIEKENEEEKEEYVWTEVLEDSKIKEYPESLMEAARTEVLEGYYDMADLYGTSHDEIFQSFGCKDEQEFKDTQLEDLAKDTVKEFLVAKAIAYKENIEYSKQDYEKLVEEEYGNYSDTYENKEAYEQDNKDYLERTALSNAVKQWIGTKTIFKK